MRKLLSFVLLVLTIPAANAQGVSQPSGRAQRIIRAASLPTTCTVGDVYFKTAATVGTYQCLTTNNWTAFSTSSGASPAGPGVPSSSNGTTFTDAANFSGIPTFNGTSAPTAALAAGITTLFSGSCPSGATCALASDGTKQTVSAFPYAYQHGTFLGIGWNNATNASNVAYPGSDVFAIFTGCSNPGTATYWFAPVGGFIRNLTMTTSGTNGNAFIRFAANPGCSNTAGAGTTGGGGFVPPGAAAGGFIDSWASNQTEWWHVPQYAPFAFGFQRQGGATTGVIASQGAEFVSDDGTSDSIFSFVQNTALTASTTQFAGIGSFLATTELNVAIPIAAAGTLKNLTFGNVTSPTANVVVTVNKNGSTSALTATITGGDTSTGNYVDITHTVAVVAGDYVDFQAVTGATTQTTILAMNVAFVPTVNQTALLWGSFNASTITTTVNYAQPFSALNSATEANAKYTFPFACTLSNLYVTQATANSGVTTTVTVRKNGADTTVTGTITAGSGTGSIAVDTTHSVAFAAGDTMDVSRVTASGTSGTMGGWGAACL